MYHSTTPKSYKPARTEMAVNHTSLDVGANITECGICLLHCPFTALSKSLTG